MIDTSALTQAVTDAIGVKDSVIAFIENVNTAMQDAVTAALEADKAANQASIDAATAAIQAETDRIMGVSAALSAAITTNPT